MDSQARVASLDRVEEFRTAYAKFGDAARQALLGVELEIRRMLDWLEKDQVAFWKGEIRRREEKVNEAKAALHRKRITATFGHVVSDTDEIVALRKAKVRLEEAEEKLKLVKQWYLLIEQEVNQYRGPSQTLGNLLDADVPRALASLDRALNTLETYLQTAAPMAESTLGADFSSPATTGSPASPAAAAAAAEAAVEAAAAQASAAEGLDGATNDEQVDTEGAS
jgi:hypothetical protein